MIQIPKKDFELLGIQVDTKFTEKDDGKETTIEWIEVAKKYPSILRQEEPVTVEDLITTLISMRHVTCVDVCDNQNNVFNMKNKSGLTIEDFYQHGLHSLLPELWSSIAEKLTVNVGCHGLELTIYSSYKTGDTKSDPYPCRIHHLIEPRQFGKTHKCIERSANTGAIIVTRDEVTAKWIMDEAKFMNLIIPKPICASILMKDSRKIPPDARLIVDDADMVLMSILGHPIDTISMVQRDEDGVESMSYNQKKLTGLV